jgi:glycosyltransferase involved in cell wall biosynthesis
MTKGDARLIVHIISGLGLGGAETVMHRLITAPTQTDRHVVISMKDEGVFGERFRRDGIDVYTLGMHGPVSVLQGLWRLWRLLRELNPDVVQTWMYHADFAGGIVARLAGIQAVAWGIRNSGADLHTSSKSSRALAWLSAKVSRLVPGVIIACAQNASQRHQQWGYRADRMLVIPNGYDLTRWQPSGPSSLRGELGLDEGTFLIGNVARWNPLKDHETLLSAVAQCRSLGAAWRLVLIGEGLTRENVALSTLIERYGLAGQVILLGRRDDVPEVMKALDLHVLSSRAEGFPNVLAEAMASGVPCVTTDVGDAAYIVGEYGWVAPARNAGALAQAIDQAARSRDTPEFAQRILGGRERVSSLFSLDAMVRAYRQVWHRLAMDYPRTRETAARPAVLEAMRRRHSSTVSSAISGQPRLLFLVNNPAFFLSHRLPLAIAARNAGYEVHVATMDGPSVATITAQGLTHHVIPMSRSGKNPVQELQSLYAMWRLFRQLKPALVHAVTIKPVLYGGIAARLAGVPAYVAAISGLGFVFMREQQGLDLVRRTAIILYRLALGHSNSRVIFQNENDRDVLLAAGVVRKVQVVMLRGSGVDLEEFSVRPEPDGAPKAVMVARLLEDKGVREFVQAARLTAGHASGLRWMLAGSPDPGNPASITQALLEEWRDEGAVELLGEREDIAALYQQSHIAVLPSYREGLPKSLVEAAACGRPVVTTDVPGCRDAILAGETGLLVPVKDAHALAQAVLQLAGDEELRQRMGQAARLLAQDEFDVNRIAQAHVALYNALTVRESEGAI